MKTSFSVKVTIESNDDGGGGAANDGDNPIVEFMESLINDAIKKHIRDKGTTIEEAEEAKDVYSPLPQRRIPSDADDKEEEEDPSNADDSVDNDGDDASTVDPDASNDDEDEDQVSDLLPNVEIDNEYEEDYELSQKMGLMSLRRRD